MSATELKRFGELTELLAGRRTVAMLGLSARQSEQLVQASARATFIGGLSNFARHAGVIATSISAMALPVGKILSGIHPTRCECILPG